MNNPHTGVQLTPGERTLARNLATLLWMIAALQLGILLCPAL